MLSASCVAVTVCCECVLRLQLFELQSSDLYSCEGDLDSQTSDFHLSLRGILGLPLPACEENTHCLHKSTITHPFQHTKSRSQSPAVQSFFRYSVLVYLRLYVHIINRHRCNCQTHVLPPCSKGIQTKRQRHGEGTHDKEPKTRGLQRKTPPQSWRLDKTDERTRESA